MKTRKRPSKHVRRVKTKKGKRNVVVNRRVKKRVKRESFDVPASVQKGIVKEYLQQVSQDLKRSGRSRLPEVGILRVQTKKARPSRMGVNPFTGERQKFKARPRTKVVKFRPAKNLKQRIARK